MSPIKKVLGAAAILALAGCSTTTGQATTPPKTVTQQVTRPVTEQVVTTETVEKTPAGCLEAIRLARQGFIAAGDMMGIFSTVVDGIPDALESALYQDAAGIREFTAIMEQANTDLLDANESLDPQGFNAAAADCEAGR